MFVSNLNNVRNIVTQIEPLVSLVSLKPIHHIGDVGIMTPDLNVVIKDMQHIIMELDKIYDDIYFARGILETYFSIDYLSLSPEDGHHFVNLCAKSLLPLQDASITYNNMIADDNLIKTLYALQTVSATMEDDMTLIGWRDYECVMIKSDKIPKSIKEDMYNEYQALQRSHYAPIPTSHMV